jgi:hypothetical protein
MRDSNPDPLFTKELLIAEEPILVLAQPAIVLVVNLVIEFKIGGAAQCSFSFVVYSCG